MNILLLGVMITQVYLYYVQYKKLVFHVSECWTSPTTLYFRDKLWIKIFVSPTTRAHQVDFEQINFLGCCSVFCRPRELWIQFRLHVHLPDKAFW